MGTVSIRDKHESAVIRKLARLLSEQQRAILDVIHVAGRIELGMGFWEQQEHELVAGLRPVFQKIFVEHASRVVPRKAPIGRPGDFVNVEAMNWVNSYVIKLAQELDLASQEIVRKYLLKFITEGDYTISDFAEDIEYLFGYSRAKMIAVTEVTRAYSQATLAIKEEYEAMGTPMIEVWRTTVEPGRNCGVCEARHDRDRGDGWTEPPPAHPNCMCDLVLRIDNARL